MSLAETAFVTGSALPDGLQDAASFQLISPESLAELVAPLFGMRSPPVAVPSEGGAITRFVHWGGRDRLATYNDTSNLGRRPAAVIDALADDLPVVALIRHGRTAANVAGRWQGSLDDPLDDEGERQADALFEWYGRVDSVWSSPLRRAASRLSRLPVTRLSVTRTVSPRRSSSSTR